MARRRPARLVFTAVWLVVWLAAMLVAGYALVDALLRGIDAPVPILLLWLAGAAFGLWRVGRRFGEALSGERLRPEPPRRGRHQWMDGMPEGRGRERDGGRSSGS